MDEIKPTELTAEDINKFFEKLMTEEIKMRQCWKCSKEHFPNYGSFLNECDECYFEKWPKQEREAFYRSFFD